ncbi:MAG: FixH family protein [Bacteroidetes bacterium]|nr:FixH family protein [Bacteroidota bacterium]MBS1935293.1 FixH family protein [Bacteroidota bacterium]
MNWGNKLILVFIAFAGWMGYLAYRATSVHIDLVENDYYKNELKYQDVIDANNRTNSLSSKIIITQDKDHINFQLPEEMKNTIVKGTVWFYCASDEKKDRHIKLTLNENAMQQLDIKNFLPGNYTVKFDWESNQKKYYEEETFSIL